MGAETVVHLERGVLDPCWYQGVLHAADLRKLPLSPRSSRFLRARRKSSGCWSGGRSPGWTFA